MSIIRQSSRKLRRGFIVAGMILAGSVCGATTAQASDLDVGLFCEPVGSYNVSCETQISGGTAPYAIKWFENGAYSPWWDNHDAILVGCNRRATWNSYKVVVTDATGLTRARSHPARCLAYAP